jgi:hypothetical protein
MRRHDVRLGDGDDDWWGEELAHFDLQSGSISQLNEEDMRGHTKPLPRLGFAPQGGRPGDPRPARKRRKK